VVGRLPNYSKGERMIKPKWLRNTIGMVVALTDIFLAAIIIQYTQPTPILVIALLFSAGFTVVGLMFD
jgi:hypothetical protein